MPAIEEEFGVADFDRACDYALRVAWACASRGRMYTIPGVGYGEIEQAALIAAWRALQTWEENRGPLSAWVALCVRHEVAELRRQSLIVIRSRSGWQPTMVEPDESLRSEERSPEDRVQQEQIRRVLYRLSEVLSPADWLLLSDWAKGVSDAEAGARIGVGRTYIRARRRAALARARRFLAAFGVRAMTDVCAD